MNPNEASPRFVSGVSTFFTKVYGMMTASIIGSLLVAYLAAQVHIVMVGMGFIVSAIVWMVIPFLINWWAKTKPVLAAIGLVAFMILAGLMMSYVFIVYSAGVITAAFLSAASLFVIMSAIGLTTHRDVSKLGTQMLAMLIAVIVVSLINMLLHSPLIALIISIVTVVIFTILTMVDTVQIKQMYEEYGSSESNLGLAIVGCLSLYLDFINLFLQLLQIFAAASNNNDN